MARPAQSYLSAKLEARRHPGKGGKGIFALADVEPGELLIVWDGMIVPYDRLIRLSTATRSHSVQVEEGLYQVLDRASEAADFLNHSCNPNAGMSGQIAVVAMRGIHLGEEVCIDYAMVDGSPYDEFECHCGEPECRGAVTGEDWARPELWERYRGHFSPYLQRRIETLQVQKALRPRRVARHARASR
jgi:hypothetical protein